MFFAATVAVFGWGVFLGVRGAMADHPPFRRGANASGAGTRPRLGAA